MEQFLNILAWIFGISNTLLVLLRIYAFVKYENNPLEQMADTLERKVRVFPIMTPLIIAIICWVWLLT